MEESFIDEVDFEDIKIEATPVKDIVVPLERLSNNTILKYTRKSKVSYSKKENESIRLLLGQYCRKCKETITTATEDKKLKLCQKCGTELLYKCLKCKIEYRLYNSVFNHIRTKCGCASRYSCSLCDFTTSDKYYLQTHMFRLHSNENNSIECKKCGKRLKNRHSLRSHLYKCGRSPDLLCDFCNYKTLSKYHLTDHLRRHSLDRSKPLSREDKIDRVTEKYCRYITRYCKNCEVEIAHNGMQGRTICPKCNSTLIFTCVKCNLQLPYYNKMIYHMQKICCAQESKCSSCGKIYPSIIKLKSHSARCGKPQMHCKYCRFKTPYKKTLDKHEMKHVMKIKNSLNQDVKDDGDVPEEVFATVQTIFIKEEVELSTPEGSDNEG